MADVVFPRIVFSNVISVRREVSAATGDYRPGTKANLVRIADLTW